jgi:membrane protein DedA with SNARE-associated domain
VLLAGVARIGVVPFTIAIAIGRGARYFVEALLALWYGERAIAYMHDNAATVSLWLVGLLAVAVVGYILWGRVRAARRR